MRYNFIAIEGIIGAGKTTLANMLSNKFKTPLILEEFSDNPFLKLFYDNPKRYAFSLEMSFLAERYQQLTTYDLESKLFPELVVSDYYIGKCLVFAQNNLNEHEFELYKTFFFSLLNKLHEPELIVYLHLSVEKALEQIEKRGRSYETKIKSDYLKDLHRNYFDFFKQKKNVPIVIIDTSELDFVAHPKDFEKIQSIIFQEHKNGINLFT